MSELSHILGAILKDITKARVMSDIYSKKTFEFYREDNILQHFPVPRIDISNMEIELKLAVLGEKTLLKDTEEGKIYHEKIEFLSTEIATTFVQEFIKLLSWSDRIIITSSTMKEIKTMYENEDFINSFSKSIACKLYSGLEGLISMNSDNEVFKKKIKADFIEKFKIELSNSVFYRNIEEVLIRDLASETQKNNVKALMNEYLQKIFSDKLYVPLETMSNKLLDILCKDNIQGLLVAVTPEELKNIPDEKITSFKLSINIQNYGITEVEAEESQDNKHFSIHPE